MPITTFLQTKRIFWYFRMLKNSKSTGDIFEVVARFIEVPLPFKTKQNQHGLDYSAYSSVAFVTADTLESSTYGFVPFNRPA